MVDISDQEWVEKYKITQNLSDLTTLYKSYMPLVYGVGLKYLQNRSDAEDLTMTVFEHIANKLKTHNVDNFKSWLYVVTKNLCYEKLRKQKRIQAKESDAAIMYSENVFHPDTIKDDEVIDRLSECMDLLKKEQKACIEDFYYNTLSYKVIAKKYQISWNTVRSNIQNGRRMLKNCIEKGE